MNVREIAKAVGVSPATVSLVLNNKPGVKAETRQIVSKMLIENGYSIRTSEVPKSSVRLTFLRYNGVNHEKFDPLYDFFVEILNGVERQASEYGYALSLENADHASLERTIQDAAATSSGIIVFGSELEQDAASTLFHSPCPLIVIDANFLSTPIHSVNADNASGMFQAVRHLQLLGHKKIGYLNNSANTGSIPDRFFAFQTALKTCQLTYHPELTISLPPHLQLAAAQMGDFLQSHPSLPTAFVGSNDSLTLGAMQALQQYGYRIPEDISLIGFDDSYLASLSQLPLTSVSIPKEMLGRTAVRQLKLLLDNPDDKTVYKIQLCTSLIERQSEMRLV